MESVPPLELQYQMLSHPCHMGPNPYFLVLFIWSSQNTQSCSICLSCLSSSSPAFLITLALQAHLPAALPSLHSLQSLYLTSVAPFQITLNTFTRKSWSLAQKRLCIFTMIALQPFTREDNNCCSSSVFCGSYIFQQQNYLQKLPCQLVN